MMGSCLLCVVLLAGGAQPGGAVALDVVSVRPAPDAASGYVRVTPGRLLAEASVERLIAFALGLRSVPRRALVEAGVARDDVLSRRFTIAATLTPRGALPPPPGQRALVLALLRDYFGLRTHTESRRSLVLALRRTGEGLGPGLVRLEADCAGGLERGEARPAACVPPPRRDGVEEAPGVGDMAMLAAALEGQVGTVVVDETGIAGSLTWRLPFFVRVPPPGVASFAEVLRDDLGLELVPTEAEVDVVVIEAVSLPDPN